MNIPTVCRPANQQSKPQRETEKLRAATAALQRSLGVAGEGSTTRGSRQRPQHTACCPELQGATHPGEQNRAIPTALAVCKG